MSKPIPGVYPYALLQDDPTTEMGISWIDNLGKDGDEQTVYYGTDPDDLSESESADGEAVKSSDANVYHTTLTGLDPGTTYHIEIDSAETVTHKFETMPDENPGRTRHAITSDHHPWRGANGMARVSGSKPMKNLGRKDFEILLFPGDWLTDVQDGNEEDAEDWMEWWSKFGVKIDRTKLHPYFTVPGNHEVAKDISQTWSGDPDSYDEEDLTPDAGHYQQFFPNTKELGPTDENYASVTVSDYLQVIGLDTYSAFPADQTDWLKETIDPDVDHVIPIIHAPLLPGANRGSDQINKTIREEWARILYDADNVYFTMVGDNHTRKYTYPWRVVDEEPSHDEYLNLDGDGYLVVDESGDDPNRMYEFGDGWYNDRDDPPTDGDGNEVTWYLDYAELQDNDETQVYTSSFSDDQILVHEWDDDGDRLDWHAVRGDGPLTTGTPIASFGESIIGDVTFGEKA